MKALVCRDALLAGRLVRVLPEWRGQQRIVHLVFTTRRGLSPAVRALIDHLAGEMPRGSPSAVLELPASARLG